MIKRRKEKRKYVFAKTRKKYTFRVHSLVNSSTQTKFEPPPKRENWHPRYVRSIAAFGGGSNFVWSEQIVGAFWSSFGIRKHKSVDFSTNLEPIRARVGFIYPPQMTGAAYVSGGAKFGRESSLKKSHVPILLEFDQTLQQPQNPPPKKIPEKPLVAAGGSGPRLLPTFIKKFCVIP